MEKKAPKKKRNLVGISLTEEDFRELQRKAEKMHLTPTDYARRVLLEWLREDKSLTIQEP